MQVHRISDTIQKFDGVSYYRCGPYFQRKGKRLHRMVWEFHNGEIPAGFDVHHADGDRTNNNIDNLQLLPGSEHHSLHMRAPERKAQARVAIQRAQDGAKAWHGSEAGREWHSQHAKEMWVNAGMNTYVCTFCGKEYQTLGKYGRGSNTFCSNNCKSAWRRKQGYDNEQRVCPVCGESFTVNKYSKQTYCSRECARRVRWGR